MSQLPLSVTPDPHPGHLFDLESGQSESTCQLLAVVDDGMYVHEGQT